MRGIWLVVNHNSIMVKDSYQGFADPAKAREYAISIGWKEEVPGSFDEDPNGPNTYMNGKFHVTILFIPVTA